MSALSQALRTYTTAVVNRSSEDEILSAEQALLEVLEPSEPATIQGGGGPDEPPVITPEHPGEN